MAWVLRCKYWLVSYFWYSSSARGRTLAGERDRAA
jgi:hypothetical protein